MGIKDVDKVNNAGDAVDTEVACLSGDPTRASHVISSPPPLSSQKHQILNLLSDDPLYASSSFSPKAPSSGTAVLLPGKWMTKWLNAVDFKQGDEGVYVFGWEVTEEEFEVDDKEREREKVCSGGGGGGGGVIVLTSPLLPLLRFAPLSSTIKSSIAFPPLTTALWLPRTT
jgi:hypothetical protein